MNLADFVISVQLSPPAGRFSVIGELDAFRARELNHQVTAAVADGCTQTTLDLASVTFVDGGGIGTLVRLHTDATASGGNLVIGAASACVRRLCTLLDVHGLLRVEPLLWAEGRDAEVVA